MHTAPRGGQNYFFEISFFGLEAKFGTYKVVCYSKKLNIRLFRVLKLPLKLPHLPRVSLDTVDLLCKTLAFIKHFPHLDPKGPLTH